MLLEVGLAGAGELHGDELEAAVLEARDDVANEATLDAIGLDGNEAVEGKCKLAHCIVKVVVVVAVMSLAA